MIYEEPPINIKCVEDAISFIYKTSWKESKYDLSRITKLMKLLQNPQKKLKFIHIAGTNGKGSTSAMIASIFMEAGYKTGLYTSPYIHKLSERIQINFNPIKDVELLELSNQLYKYISSMQDAPTEFEIITAIAFLYFYQNQCDIVILEVGMGGRLDATNIIDTPESAVITSIGLDHTKELGDTIEKIAAEKAGIIKSNGIVICCPQKDSVKKVIYKKCKNQNTKLYFVDNNIINPVKQSLDGQQFDYNGIKNLTISLLGQHQLLNAASAITTVNVLKNQGWNISEEALRSGLQKVSWPGRFEIMQNDPIFIVDGAHNPQGIQTTKKTLQSFFPNKKCIFILGVLVEKNYQEMIKIIAPLANYFITVTPNNPTALPARNLASYLKKVYYINTIICKSIEHGLEVSLKIAGKDDVICAVGSLYMVGAIRNYFKSCKLLSF